jgi:hypothetical protein
MIKGMREILQDLSQTHSQHSTTALWCLNPDGTAWYSLFCSKAVEKQNLNICCMI